MLKPFCLLRADCPELRQFLHILSLPTRSLQHRAAESQTSATVSTQPGHPLVLTQLAATQAPATAAEFQKKQKFLKETEA